MRFSMYMTFATKLRSTTCKVLEKYYRNREFSVEYKGAKGQTHTVTLYKGGFKRKIGETRVTEVDVLPNPYVTYKTGLYNRLAAGICERCGAKDKLKAHQVRTLKAPKGAVDWEKLMIKRNRKTLVVCNKCNNLILSYQTDNVNGEPYTSRGVRTVQRRIPENLSQK